MDHINDDYGFAIPILLIIFISISFIYDPNWYDLIYYRFFTLVQSDEQIK